MLEWRKKNTAKQEDSLGKVRGSLGDGWQFEIVQNVMTASKSQLKIDQVRVFRASGTGL